MDRLSDITAVQVRGERFRVPSEVVDAEDKRRRSPVWPAYDAYQQRTDREIPVVRLRRVS